MKRNLRIDKWGRALAVLCLGLLASVAQAEGQPGFVCGGGDNSIEIMPGGSETLHISLDGAESVVGFQLDISLPEGLSIAPEEIALADGNVTHSVAAAIVAGEKRYRIVAFSSANAAFAGGDSLLSIPLIADEGFDGGNIGIDNSVLALVDGSSAEPEPMAISVRPSPLSGAPDVLQASSRTVEVYDIHGRLMLSEAAEADGPHSISIRRGMLPEGVYIIRSGTSATKILIK